jgi:hypothetical protein
MNIKIEKTFKVNDYDFNRNILEIEVKLTIQSSEESEIYLSTEPGKMDLARKLPETVMFILESKDIPIPDYVSKIIISQSDQYAFELRKITNAISHCEQSPFITVCTIENLYFDEEAVVQVVEMLVQQIEIYWEDIASRGLI